MNAKPFCLELPPVFPIDDPLTGSRGVFAGRDGGRVADERNPAILANGAGVPAEEAEVAPAPFGEDVGVEDEG